MKKRELLYDVNLRSKDKEIREPLWIKQQEEKSARIYARIRDGTVVRDLTGYTAIFECSTPNHKFIRKEATIDEPKKGLVFFDAVEEVYQRAGEIRAQFVLSKDESAIVTPFLIFKVEPDVVSDPQVYGNVVAEYIEIRRMFDGLVKEFKEATETGVFKPGKDAAIEVGGVTSLGSNEEAYVTNTGTQTDVVFNFGIPRGEQGLPGPPGQEGKGLTEEQVAQYNHLTEKLDSKLEEMDGAIERAEEAADIAETAAWLTEEATQEALQTNEQAKDYIQQMDNTIIAVDDKLEQVTDFLNNTGQMFLDTQRQMEYMGIEMRQEVDNMLSEARDTMSNLLSDMESQVMQMIESVEGRISGLEGKAENQETAIAAIQERLQALEDSING